jgi:hypothetical protein
MIPFEQHITQSMPHQQHRGQKTKKTANLLNLLIIRGAHICIQTLCMFES